MPFLNFGLQDMCCRKCLKSHVLVHPGTVNMLQPPKHYFNMHDSSFISFVYHFGKISVEKVFPSNI